LIYHREVGKCPRQVREVICQPAHGRVSLDAVHFRRARRSG
jgi:hypothetical protein